MARGNRGEPYRFSKVEAILIADERLLIKQLADVRQILDNIRSKRVPLDDPNLPPVKPTDYPGMRAVDALEVYLKARRGTKVQLSKAVSDLIQGGVDPGRPRWSNKEPEFLVTQTLKIGLSNNPKVFDWTPQDVSKKGRTIVKKGASNDEIYIWLAKDADEPRRRAR